MPATGRVTAHVTYPPEPTRSAENNAWLVTATDATAFAAEPADTGRWQAHLSTTR